MSIRIAACLRAVFSTALLGGVLTGGVLAGGLLAGCASDGRSSGDAGAVSAPSVAASADTSFAEAPTVTSTTGPAATTVVPVASAPVPSAPVPSTELPAGPPVFEIGTLGSNLTLPSFVVTVAVANTNSGQLVENVTTSGYIAAPLSTYELATFGSGGVDGGTRHFNIDGRSYEENQFGDWYLDEAGSGEAAIRTDRLDLRSGIVSGVLTAEFDGPAEFAGVPANHFVFDETDLANFSSFTPERPSPAVSGELYLAQDGNYVLYAHSIETSPGRTYEVTETLSSIGVVPPITLPPELVPMTQALDLGVQLGSLLPPGSTLSSMIRYKNGIGLDSYVYRTPESNMDKFLNFYRTLAVTNGWTVSHIGHIKLHLEPINCETDRECVILTNGGEQLVVALSGTITLEYDHQHIFSPA